MAEIEIYSVSQAAEVVEIGDYPPLSDEQLDELIDWAKYGLALHGLLGFPDDDPLPVHIHPKTILAMVQEIQVGRANNGKTLSG